MMFQREVKFNLPKPWNNEEFKLEQIGFINFLVGPNGAGKSQFAEQLKNYFNNGNLKCRVLSADRLTGFGFSTKPDISNGNYVASSSSFEQGYNKSSFVQYKQGAEYLDTGADAFVLLEEQLGLKIKVEAILSQILNRDLRLEWEDGKLVPKVYNSLQCLEYEVKKESHGVKELLILLTHLYDGSHKVLIIDEPELNLHPQYQAFLLEHIRKVSGDPERGKKLVFLITHSPFMLDFKTVDDLKSVICFHSNFRLPSFINAISADEEAKLQLIIPQLNVHHKQMFFADNPIFVEGIFDTQFIKALQAKRGVSIEGSGSSIIDVNGNTQLSSYYLLSQKLGKTSYFIYDLDSLFFHSELHINADQRDEVNDFILKLGISIRFKESWGNLTKTIDKIKPKLKSVDCAYKNYISNLEESTEKNKRESYALLVYLIHYNSESEQHLGSEGRLVDLCIRQLNIVIDALEEIKVFILRNGALENYYPSYSGKKFKINDDLKRGCLGKEIEFINQNSLPEIKIRYGSLYETIEKLPSSQTINYLQVIEHNLQQLIFDIQRGISTAKITQSANISSYLGKKWDPYAKILEIINFDAMEQKFTIKLKDVFGLGEKQLHVDKDTNYATTRFNWIN